MRLLLSSSLPLLLLAIASLGLTQETAIKYSREDFPSDFVFGAGTSAYQYEGAVAEDGRSPSTWDTFTHAGNMPGKSTGDVASDGYHKYKLDWFVDKVTTSGDTHEQEWPEIIKRRRRCRRWPGRVFQEDVKLMSELGLEAYRFSISWSRLLPNGRGAVNPKGLKYYNGLINKLVEHGIQPHITLHHVELPQVLEDEYGGWLSPKIIEDTKEYADVCFREFGDRVSHWTTINEPNILTLLSYEFGLIPPQRCSFPFWPSICSAGNSSVEPYIAMHNVLLAHAAVVRLYRTKYQVTLLVSLFFSFFFYFNFPTIYKKQLKTLPVRCFVVVVVVVVMPGKHSKGVELPMQAIQKGWIGLNVYTFWPIPISNSSANVEAAKRATDFIMGWVINPLVFGDYPEIMKEKAGQRLPSFTKRESEEVKGSFDFIGLNHYTSAYVKDSSNSPSGPHDFISDISLVIIDSKNGTIGQILPAGILNIYPPGLQKLLRYLKQEYGNPPIYIHENGYEGFKHILNDTDRIDYLDRYIRSTLDAIRDGSNVRGYFVWSFLDVFELATGYESSYGLYYVDFSNVERKRQPKLSARWYSNFLANKNGIRLKQRSGIQRVYNRY